MAVGGAGGDGAGVHLRDRTRGGRGQPRPDRRVRHGRGAGPAQGSARRPKADRRWPDDPFPVWCAASRGRGKELPVTHHPEQKGFTVWFTGLSGAGKSTLAEMLYHELRKRDLKVEMLDGDVVRTNLSKGLGFSKEDRDTNILRIGFVANLLSRNGVATIVSAISPYREARNQTRAMIRDFAEVFVHATVEECARRDVKGLYAKALAGEIKGFTGVDDPYEPPQSPEIYIDTMAQEPVESLRVILDKLGEMGYIEERAPLLAY